MANADMNQVVPIDESDFSVASGDPDVRGWEVTASDGRKVGEVHNLLVDPSAMKVRYLDVKVERDLLPEDEGGGDHHILVPIGYAQLARDDNEVRVDQLSSADVRHVPAYHHEPVTREYETTLRTHYESGYAAGTADPDFYGSDLYDDRRFYGSDR